MDKETKSVQLSFRKDQRILKLKIGDRIGFTDPQTHKEEKYQIIALEDEGNTIRVIGHLVQ